MAEVYVRGMRETLTAFAYAERSAKKEVRAEFREIAEPIRHDAEAYAHERIPRIGKKWFEMRTGVTRSAVYVAPKQKGVRRKGNQALRRPKFADLLMARAMEPSLHGNEADVERRVDHALDRIAARFDD